MRNPVSLQVIVGWRSRCGGNRGLRRGIDTVVRDDELTGNAEAHNASSGPVKHDCSRGGALRTRDCGQSRNVLHGRGRPAGATDKLKNPVRRGTLGRRVNRRPFHPAVIQGFEVGRTTNVGTAEGKNGRGRGMSSGTQRELSEELAGSALKSMGMSRCWREAARRGSERTGTRSCVQKGQWSPQEWTDRTKHS